MTTRAVEVDRIKRPSLHSKPRPPPPSLKNAFRSSPTFANTSEKYFHEDYLKLVVLAGSDQSLYDIEGRISGKKVEGEISGVGESNAPER
ncbi:hypothetical protein V6N13_125569 [Hibiscus sabdariffa]